MPSQSGGGFGRGGHRGLGGGFNQEPTDECICTNCNHREPHQRRMPCQNKKCPKCGAHMIRV